MTLNLAEAIPCLLPGNLFPVLQFAPDSVPVRPPVGSLQNSQLPDQTSRSCPYSVQQVSCPDFLNFSRYTLHFVLSVQTAQFPDFLAELQVYPAYHLEHRQPDCCHHLFSRHQLPSHPPVQLPSGFPQKELPLLC